MDLHFQGGGASGSGEVESTMMGSPSVVSSVQEVERD